MSSSDNTAPSEVSPLSSIVEAVEVVKYQPQAVENIRSGLAEAFVRSTLGGSSRDFQIDAKISDHIGLTDIKKKDEKRHFDGEVMKYVQKIKDQAFQEAYEKGLTEGEEKAKQEALAGVKEQLAAQMATFADLVTQISAIQTKSYEEHEQDIIAFCYFLAQKIVHKEIEKDPEIIKNAIKKVAQAQGAKKDQFKIKLSKVDYDFIHNDLKSLAPEVDLNRATIEVDEGLSAGDVILDAANGRVDGRISTRLEQLKNILEQPE